MKNLIVLYLAILAVLLAIIGQVEATPVLNPENNHYYELVATPMLWSEASQFADSQQFKGFFGHLTTITSESEDNFVVSLLTGLQD